MLSRTLRGQFLASHFTSAHMHHAHGSVPWMVWMVSHPLIPKQLLLFFHCNSSEQQAAAHTKARIRAPDAGHSAEGQESCYHTSAQTRRDLMAAHRPSGTRAANLRATPM